MAKVAVFDTLRTLAFGGISGAYAAVGPVLTVTTRIICITNLTQGNMIFSDDSTNASGKLILPAGGFKLFDITSNMVPGPNGDDSLLLPIGLQWYVKQVTAPVSGAVYIEVVTAR